MGIGTQMDLFEHVAKAGRIMDANSFTSALRNGTIGTLNGQVNIINKPDYL
jgi:queuine/archaeosine tRNA-ribosyltransferase